MKHWNDLNNIIIIDTNIAPEILKFISTNNSLKNTIFKSFILNPKNEGKQFKNSIIFIPGLREKNSFLVKEEVKHPETVLKIMGLINNYVSVIGRKNYLNTHIEKMEEVWEEFKNDKDFDDPWLCAKILLSKQKENIFLVTRDYRFSEFLKRNSLKSTYTKKRLKIYKAETFLKLKQLA